MSDTTTFPFALLSGASCHVLTRPTFASLSFAWPSRDFPAAPSHAVWLCRRVPSASCCAAVTRQTPPPSFPTTKPADAIRRRVRPPYWTAYSACMPNVPAGGLDACMSNSPTSFRTSPCLAHALCNAGCGGNALNPRCRPGPRLPKRRAASSPTRSGRWTPSNNCPWPPGSKCPGCG